MIAERIKLFVGQYVPKVIVAMIGLGEEGVDLFRELLDNILDDLNVIMGKGKQLASAESKFLSSFSSVVGGLCHLVCPASVWRVDDITSFFADLDLLDPQVSWTATRTTVP